MKTRFTILAAAFFLALSSPAAPVLKLESARSSGLPTILSAGVHQAISVAPQLSPAPSLALAPLPASPVPQPVLAAPAAKALAPALEQLSGHAAALAQSRGQTGLELAAGAGQFDGAVTPISRESYQRDLLEMTFSQAVRGRNDSMRFGTVVTDPKTREVTGARWNSRSEPGETKGYHQEDWAHQMSHYAQSLVAQRKLHAGFISLSNSVHAEQGGMKETLQRTGLKVLDGFRLHTIGVTSDLKVGVAKAREWTCMRCAMWIDIFRPQVYELFSGGFKSFGQPHEILSTAVKNHAAKEVGYWKRVSDEKPKDAEPDVYAWVNPRVLVANRLPPVRLNAVQAEIFKAAYKLARRAKYDSRPKTKVMNFGSVLVDPQTGWIVAEAMTRGALSSERAALEKALREKGAAAIRGFHLFTVGVDAEGWVAVAEDRDSTFVGELKQAEKLGIVFHELLADGFAAVDPAATRQRLGSGRFSARYWRTVDDADERVTSPFRYYWLPPPAGVKS